MFTDHSDPKRVAEEWLGKARHAIESGMQFDDERDSGWCDHIRYVDLISDPIGVVKKIYARYGEEVGPLHERRMHAWMRDRSRESTGRHLYDPADFGWNYDALTEQFHVYQDRYDVPRE